MPTARREASGWNTADPNPINPEASSRSGKLLAFPRKINPKNVLPMPMGSENGKGRWSVTTPTTGCSSEAVA
jgi:hypothetical protein